MLRILSGIVCVIAMVSCSDPMSEVGTDFFDEVSFELQTWDSLTMNMSTIQLDSVVTNNPTRLLVGTYSSEELGTVQSDAYVTLNSFNTTALDNHSNSKYEKTTLTLYYEGYNLGDTLSTQTIEVYGLLDEIEVDDDGYLYNTTTFDKEVGENDELIPLGVIEFEPRPLSGDSIEISLVDEIGNDLFEAFEHEVTVDDFLDLFKGLVLTGKGSNCVVGFTNTPTLNVYYTEDEEEDFGEKALVFTSDDPSLSFNSIVSDRSTTNLSELAIGEYLPSEETGGKSFAQGGLGLAIKIELPYLKNLLQRDEELLIEEVNLELAIKNEIPEDIGSLISGFTISKINKNDEIIYTYETIPEWNLDLEYVDEINYFEIDITDFVQEQLLINTEEEEVGLLISLPSDRYQYSLDQMLIGDQANGSEVKMNIIKIK